MMKEGKRNEVTEQQEKIKNSRKKIILLKKIYEI